MEVDGEQEQNFDVEPYASNFSGHGKIDRLLFIARFASSDELRLEALRLAVDELKAGKDTRRYGEAIEAIKGRLGEAYQYDSEWVKQTDAAAKKEKDALEHELSGYKTNLIKESIRLGHNDLGNYHYLRGDLPEAFKCYVRARDYCTTNKHHWTACLHAITISLEMGNFNHVNTYVTKAEQQPDLKSHPEVVAKLAAAAGLSLLDAKRYKQAARKFTEVGAELGAQWNAVISPQEIALYGALCGLAHFSRAELRQHIIDNVSFREYLELYPEVRELVWDFYGSRYASTLAQLQQLQTALALDMHLQRHAADLCSAVRSKALVQYTSPFVSVHLPTMAATFNTDVDVLEKEIAELIQSNQIPARIDSGSKVLYKRRSDKRAAVFASALKSAEEYIRETKAVLVRASLLRHDVIQKAPPGQRPGKVGGGASSGSFVPGLGSWALEREGYHASMSTVD